MKTDRTAGASKLSRKGLQEGLKIPAGLALGDLRDLPERAMQFGEGVFLRGFLDWMIDGLNAKGLFNGRVAVVQPLPEGRIRELNRQDGLYTLILRGLDRGRTRDERRIITSLSRGLNPYEEWGDVLECAGNPYLSLIVSNTTEAGIVYEDERPPEESGSGGSCPRTFPGKIAAFLHERFKRFGGDPAMGFTLLPCELIEGNGDRLKEAVLRHAAAWGLDPGFSTWIRERNRFLNTLVDRIVTGVPGETLEALLGAAGYEDPLAVEGEYFHLFVIEGPEELERVLPLRQGGFNVVWTRDLAPYRERKVRILNGTHTACALAGWLSGLETVADMMASETLGALVHRIVFQEILPEVPMEEDARLDYAVSTLERFQNPFLRHELLAIALNSVSKWSVRVLPTVRDCVGRTGECPPGLALSLAALIRFYRGRRGEDGNLIGERDAGPGRHRERSIRDREPSDRPASDRQGSSYPIRDREEVLEIFAALWERYDADQDLPGLVAAVLEEPSLWGEDLTRLAGLSQAVNRHLACVMKEGIIQAVKRLEEED